MNVIRVNGKVINAPDGSSVAVVNNSVYIDGMLVVDHDLVGKTEVIIKLVIEGKLDNLTTDANVECNDVGGNLKADGNVTANNVAGGVKAIGNVNCQDVTGDVRAEGNINCGKVNGFVKAGGNLVCAR